MARKKKDTQNDPRGRSRRKGDSGRASSERALTKKEKRAAARRNVLDDYEYDYDDDQGISKSSMKRAMRFVVIAIIFFLFSLGVLFGSSVLRTTLIKNKQTVCWRHQQEVQQLAYDYMINNGFSSLPAYVEDIPGYADVERGCPSGGEYTWDPVNGKFTCSEHGDVPASFEQAQSKKIGQTTTITNKNSS